MRLAYCSLDGRTGHEAGRELLAQLYGQSAELPMPPIVVGPWGKPAFAQGQWHFSITHTPRHAFCVLARENIAVDAEELDRRVNLSLARKILSPGEMAQFEAAEDKKRALLTFWVLKEAAAKLTGRGLRGYPNDTNFSLNDSRVQEIGGCLVAILTEGENYVV